MLSPLREGDAPAQASIFQYVTYRDAIHVLRLRSKTECISLAINNVVNDSPHMYVPSISIHHIMKYCFEWQESMIQARHRPSIQSIRNYNKNKTIQLTISKSHWLLIHPKG